MALLYTYVCQKITYVPLLHVIVFLNFTFQKILNLGLCSRYLTFGCAIPRASKSSGCLTGSSMTSLISLICLSKPPTISYVESGTFSTIIKLTRGSTCKKLIHVMLALKKRGDVLRVDIMGVDVLKLYVMALIPNLIPSTHHCNSAVLAQVQINKKTNDQESFLHRHQLL